VIDEAFPGDVVGLPNTGGLAIGDTLCGCAGKVVKFAPIPRFQPELFALLRNTDVAKQKQFIKGVRQLESEGAVQVLYRLDAVKREPILAAVGQLQFDVVQARLENEYGVHTALEMLAFDVARWVSGPEEMIQRLPSRNDVVLARDSEGSYVVLFGSPFYLRYASEQFPALRFQARS
jgi:peptide chain release factor 3